MVQRARNLLQILDNCDLVKEDDDDVDLLAFKTIIMGGINEAESVKTKYAGRSRLFIPRIISASHSNNWTASPNCV